MQWSTEPNAGFSRADKLPLPVISKGPYSYERVNAAEQRRNSSSLLNWTERMIRMRKEVPEFGWGDFQVVDTGHNSVLALHYTWRNNEVLAVHNLLDETIEVQFTLKGDAGLKLVSLFDHAHNEADKRGRHRLVLEPYAYFWYRLGGLGYLLDRSEA
jgi:maltose alpha-D-glucosyltransferase / alpha-amylase